jgi:membrane-bound serine protease (ClpP class)
MMVLGAVLVAVGPAASAFARDDSPTTQVNVIEVSGYLDPVLVDFVHASIDQAEDDGALALVLQLNSPGSAVSDADLQGLIDAVQASTVPVTTWIGPSDSRALGAAGELALATTEVGMAPGTRIEADGRVYDDEAAVEQDIVDRSAPTVGIFVNDLPGFETEQVGGDTEPVTETHFGQLPLSSQLFHTASSPAVAYLFFVLGMGLILFELYTAGVGVAGVIAAALFVFGAYGLATLPARGWAVALLVISMIAFAIDVQTGVPRFWTGVGFITFAVGTFFLYDGPQLSWITLVGTFAALAVAVLAGMPAMVRTRFSTPTIGREWMIGEEGEAVTPVDPDGTVRVRNALWRARTNRATPLATGDPIVVAGLDGLVLEVESTDPERRPKEHRRS